MSIRALSPMCDFHGSFHFLEQRNNPAALALTTRCFTFSGKDTTTLFPSLHINRLKWTKLKDRIRFCFHSASFRTLKYADSAFVLIHRLSSGHLKQMCVRAYHQDASTESCGIRNSPPWWSWERSSGRTAALCGWWPGASVGCDLGAQTSQMLYTDQAWVQIVKTKNGS